MSAQARCSRRRTANPDADGGFPRHPIWNIQPEGLVDILIKRQTIRGFLDEWQLLLRTATKNRRRRSGCCGLL